MPLTAGPERKGRNSADPASGGRQPPLVFFGFEWRAGGVSPLVKHRTIERFTFYQGADAPRSPGFKWIDIGF
jgi:hypothetical protein